MLFCDISGDVVTENAVKIIICKITTILFLGEISPKHF